LILSRTERDDPTPDLVQLDLVVDELRPTLQALTQGHALRLRLAPVSPVLGHRGRLEQVIVNLVDNAAKYTPPDGAIDVDVGNEAESVVLRVSDTGAGIPPEVVSHIFERFYRADSSRARSTGGFGLGLSIVQSVVTAHRGTVDVSSENGRGTAVTVCLPSVVVDES